MTGTTMIDRARSLMPTRQQLQRQVESYWLEVGDATTVVLVRTFYGFVAFLWTATLVPDLGIIFLDGGLNPRHDYDSGTLLSLFRWVEHDVVYVAAVVTLLVSSACVVAGRGVRMTVPLTAFLHISLIDASAPWGIGAERTMILGALYLGVFTAFTPSHLQGHFADRHGSRGVAPIWGIRLMQLQLAIGYLATGVSKLGGGDWLDGSAVYHAIEADQLQRFDPPAWLSDNVWTIKSMTYTALGVELVLAPLLLWPRTRRWAVLLALGLHISFEVFLELGFFALAMAVLILSFAPTADVRRILDRGRRPDVSSPATAGPP